MEGLFRNLSFGWNNWYVVLGVILGLPVYVAGKELLHVRWGVMKSGDEAIGSFICHRPRTLEECRYFEGKVAKVMSVCLWLILATLMTVESWSGFAQVVLNLSSDNDPFGAYIFGFLAIMGISSILVLSLDLLSWVDQWLIAGALLLFRVLQIVLWIAPRDFYAWCADRREQKREVARKEAERIRKRDQAMILLRDSADNRQPVDSTARFTENDSDYAYAQLEKNGAHYGEFSNIIRIRGKAE